MGESGYFFDPETGIRDPRIELRRDGPKKFELLRRFGYQDSEYDEPFIVPATLDKFATDLTSIPWVFAWVVPGLGTHLPAALLHDALVVSDGEEKTHEGPDVSREQADRIFRDGMKALGTPLVRRWLIWAGASLGTVWTTIAPTKYWRIMMILFFGGLSFAGIVHTLDVFDYGWRLPWLGDRSWALEVPVAAAVALILPLAAALLLCGKRWRVGAITGVALAVLLPPTILILGAFVLYRILETLVSRSEGTSPSIDRNLRIGKYATGE